MTERDKRRGRGGQRGRIEGGAFRFSLQVRFVPGASLSGGDREIDEGVPDGAGRGA